MSHIVGRRDALALGVSAGTALWCPAWAGRTQVGATSSLKVLRYAFPAAGISFDPAQSADLESNTVVSGILEAPYEYEYLASPARIRPCTAVAMPEASADFRTFTVRIRPGIFFADDPAFKGQPRELVAQDYVYSLKRFYDPRWKSGAVSFFEVEKVLGLSELRQQAIQERSRFDYDAPVQGVRALDRYTIEFRLAEPSPRFVYKLVGGSLLGAVAREVVEFYGDEIGAHPVGTGPFGLAQWVRGSRIRLKRHSRYREVRYDEHPPDDDPALREMADRLRGRRLPMLDEIDIAVIEESQPSWLAFLNEEADLVGVPPEYASVAMPGNRLAPYLAARGIGMERRASPAALFTYFSMVDPVVGGYDPAQVALRRAIALGFNVQRSIQLVYGGQAVPAQSIIVPGAYGFDPALRTEMSTFDRARANALLDLFGYMDRDGDGWRERPDGGPLTVRCATQTDQTSRQDSELWQKDMQAIGIRMLFEPATWTANATAAQAGKLMMWSVGWRAQSPDDANLLFLAYGANKGQANLAQFNLPAFNVIFERQRTLPDGPERLELIRKAALLLVAYMPYKVQRFPVGTTLTHPWVIGYCRQPFADVFWKYVDIDNEVRQTRRGGAGA